MDFFSPFDTKPFGGFSTGMGGMGSHLASPMSSYYGAGMSGMTGLSSQVMRYQTIIIKLTSYVSVCDAWSELQLCPVRNDDVEHGGNYGGDVQSGRGGPGGDGQPARRLLLPRHLLPLPGLHLATLLSHAGGHSTFSSVHGGVTEYCSFSTL